MIDPRLSSALLRAPVQLNQLGQPVNTMPQQQPMQSGGGIAAALTAGNNAFANAPVAPVPAQPRPTIIAGPQTDALAQALIGDAQNSPKRTPFEALGKLAELWAGNRQADKYVQAQAAREEAKKQQAQQESMAKLAQFNDLVQNQGKTPQEAAMLTGVFIDEAGKAMFEKPKRETYKDANDVTRFLDTGEPAPGQNIGAATPGNGAKPPPGYEWGPDGKLKYIEGGPADPKGPASKSGNIEFDNVAKLRTEVQGLPSYKNYAQALPIYRSMVKTAPTNSRASDLNLVYGLGKIMDPSSVVREGEMVMVKGTASLPDWLIGTINSLNGGAALTPDTRNAILAEANNRINGYKQSFDQDSEVYKGIATRAGFNIDDVLPNFGEVPEWPPKSNVPDFNSPKYNLPPQEKGPQPGTVEDGYRFKGGDPADRKNWERVTL